MCNIQEYVQSLIDEGWITEDGKPLKCKCGCTNFEMKNAHYCSYGVEEYDEVCKYCGEIVGHWAYGHWCLL